jgi:hypothetical protein
VERSNPASMKKKLASAGIKKNKYYEMLQKELTIKDLFIMT